VLKNERAQTRREKNKAAKLRRIEKAARRLFAERGYDATTTRDIADAAEIGIGTLFVYFPEKLDLLVHVHREDLAGVTAKALANRDRNASLVAQLAGIFRALYDYWAKHTELARVFNKELMFLSPERQGGMVALTAGFLQGLAGVVDEAKARGEVRADMPSIELSYQCFASYYLGLLLWLAGTVPREVTDTQMRASLELLMQGARP
jgi:AcrR family transcriptional regulator